MHFFLKRLFTICFTLVMSLNTINPQIYDLWLQSIAKSEPKIEDLYKDTNKYVYSISKNIIESNPIEIELKSYNFSATGSKLKFIFELLALCPNLKTLEFCLPGIPFIPDSICKLNGLTSLDLSNNSLEELPQDLYLLDKLEKLNLDNNSFSKFPEAITKMKILKSLSLEYSCLTDIPKTICNLTNLKHLDLYKNNFNCIPEEIATLVNLEELEIGGMEIYDIPYYILRLQNIYSLDISDSKLTRFPTNILGLKNLKNLNLSRNDIKEVKEDLSVLTNLESLDLFKNPQLSYVDLSFITKNENFYKLNLKNTSFTQFPLLLLSYSANPNVIKGFLSKTFDNFPDFILYNQNWLDFNLDFIGHYVKDQILNIKSNLSLYNKNFVDFISEFNKANIAYVDSACMLVMNSDDYTKISGKLAEKTEYFAIAQLSEPQIEQVFTNFYQPLLGQLVKMGVILDDAEEFLLNKIGVKYPDFIDYANYREHHLQYDHIILRQKLIN